MRLLGFTFLLTFTTPGLGKEEEEACCSDCLLSDSLKGIDALNFNACQAGDEGCCFENQCHMSRLGSDYIWDPSMKFESLEEGGPSLPVVEAGQWVQLEWNSAERLTYVIINENQAKLSQPKNTSRAALYEQGWFQMCAQNPGFLYFRAWADNGCTASPEIRVKVKASTSSSITCSGRPRQPNSKVRF